MTKVGTVYLVGGGPGDPELTTVRARSLLAQADVVLYDALIHADQLRDCRPDAEVRYVGKRAGRVTERQASINAQLVSEARAGRRVVRLKGGDPYLFGRGSEEAQYLHEHGVPFEVVPGVPSPLAATAYAGISLTHRDLASSIAYVTATESPDKTDSAHDWDKLATATQTIVFFMGVRKLGELMQKLVAHGRPATCPAAVIQSASLPEQRTVIGTVRDIAQRAADAGIGMPALTVVGEVVRLRSELRWYDKQPLFGRVIGVTRPSAQAHGMASALRRVGAEPLLVPAIEVVPPEQPARLAEAVRQAADYDWVVFTSTNGVDAYFAELSRQDGDLRRLGGVRVAAIGPATADALRTRGLRPDVVPDEFRGEAVAAAMLDADGDAMRGQRVLLPRAAVARDALPDALRAAGAQVTVVAAYQTVGVAHRQVDTLREALQAARLSALTFTSPSTVQHTLAALDDDRDLLGRTCIAAIGPITAEAARDAGLAVAVVADDYTSDGLISALSSHFASEVTS